MTLRSTEQRKKDILAALAKNGDAWLATSSKSAQPHLIAVSSWWDSRHIVIATLGGNRTALNLDSTHLARLADSDPGVPGVRGNAGPSRHARLAVAGLIYSTATASC